MNRSLTWVIGRGGLLGGHLESTLDFDNPGSTIWHPKEPFQWKNREILNSQLKNEIEVFCKEASRGYSDWKILWSAGAGVVGTEIESLRLETQTFSTLLQSLHQSLTQEKVLTRGFFFLASSAGAVYGNSNELPITETSTCNPISHYGKNKLIQEKLLTEWASSHPTVSCLIGRISNLYGTSQNISKPQGLISQISAKILLRRPIDIYVPLDTIRDYILADDCAKDILNCVRVLEEGRRIQNLPNLITKIFASEKPHSIGHVLSTFSLIAKRMPRILCSDRSVRSQHPLAVTFRSKVLERRLSSTLLIEGIHRLHLHNLSLYLSGKLIPKEVGR